MGSKGKEMVTMKIQEVIELLNKALADEWLAYYQYWIGAKMVRGLTSQVVAAELEEHAGEELKHANMLVERILQLDGTPILKPEEWYKKTNCGYEAPTNPSEIAILQQNIKGERCAIEVYKKLFELCKDKDIITAHLVLHILKDEITHEDDLQKLLEDRETKN
ncbi:MAG: ferritin-like domain-containing protein [Chlamydiota bacterium]